MSKLKLSNQVAFLLDYQGTKVAVGLIEFLVKCNLRSFPDYLNTLYLLGADLDHIKQDKQLLNFLKSAEIKPYVSILPAEYAAPLFRQVQRNTVSEEYNGLVPEEIFEITPLLVENLQKHARFYSL